MLLACGPDPEGAARTIALVPATDAAPAPEPAVLERLVPADDPEAWDLDAAQVDVEADAGRVRLATDAPGEAIRMVLRGPRSLERLDEIAVLASCSGDTLVSAAFLRGPVTVGRTAAVAMRRSPTPAENRLPVPEGLGDRGRYDTLVLHFGDLPRVLGVHAVELREVPPSARAPAPGQEAALVELDGQSRRAVGLWPGADALLPVGGSPGSLLLSLGALGAGPRAALELRGPDGRTVASLPLAGAGDGTRAWRREVLPAPAGPLTLSARDVAVALVGEVVFDPGGPVPPPVVLITSDTHRGDHLGRATRGVVVQTPTLDALADRGLFFEDCLAVANYTNPAHVGLMTGTHPRDTGILDNRHALAREAATLAEAFAGAGYATWAAVSARHLGPAVSGLGQGFERVSAPDGAQRPADETIDVVLDWLAEPRARPLFLWLHLFDAHRPYAPPGRFDRLYYDGPEDPFDPTLPEPEGLGLLTAGLEDLRVPEFARAQYRAEVSYLDEALGRVLEAGPLADGLFAVVGDHGESMGGHGVAFDHGELHGETLHVPLILAWPGAPVGRRDDPVSQLDVGRTLLDLAGLEQVPFPGRDLREPGAPAPRFALSSHGSAAAVAAEGHLLVLHLSGTLRLHELHEVELFDLERDPDCLDDLVEQELERARRLRARLVTWLEQARPRAWARSALDDPDVLAQLKELGYVEPAREEHEGLWRPDACSWCQRMSAP